MIYTIIEDHSPYYITFKYDGLESIIDYINDQVPYKIEQSKNFGITPINYEYHIYSKIVSNQFFNLLPLSEQIRFNKNFLLSVNTLPGGGGAVHKDVDQHRTYCRFSINIPLKILDDDCITSWYSDETFKDYPSMKQNWRHAFSDFRKLDQFEPLMTASFKPTEIVLINADIWHAWDNTRSSNYRNLLSLRAEFPKDVYFEDIKSLLF